MRSSAAVFRVFGFPVHVRSGFLFFLALVVFVQGAEFGIPFAVFVAVFTLVHELGHAFAARATGAEAEISLDFMAGYAAFTPTRPLRPLERAGISFAGPGVQIALGGLVYLAVNGGFGLPDGDRPIELAVFWAGPVIGAFNLLPVLPFDGGNIAQVLVELVAPNRGRQVMQWFTVAVTVGAVVWMVVDPDLTRFMVFALIPLLSVAGSMGGERRQRRDASGRAALARAEALAWATGAAEFPTGKQSSPWFRASRSLQQGDADTARKIIVDDLVDQRIIDWWPPDAAPVEQLRPLVDLLPRPLPIGGAYSAYVLVGVLLRVGQYTDAAHYGAEAYARHRTAMTAVQVARAAAALGERTTALNWLRAAKGHTDPAALRAAVEGASEFGALRDDPELQAVLHD